MGGTQNSLVTLAIVIAFTLAQSVIVFAVMRGLDYIIGVQSTNGLMDTICQVSFANMILVGVMGLAWKHDYVGMPEVEEGYEDESN